MCPLQKSCPKYNLYKSVNFHPSNSLRFQRKYEHKCPYAHHCMELQVASSLGIRLAAQNKISNRGAEVEKIQKDVFKYGGPLGDCNVCGRCNKCQFNANDKAYQSRLAQTPSLVNKDTVINTQKENEKDSKQFVKKFGQLSKASNLLG